MNTEIDWASLRQRFSWTSVALVVVVAATVIALSLTSGLRDAPAWWQAILSGVGIIMAALLAHMDRRAARRDVVNARRNLATIIQGSLQNILCTVNDLRDFNDSTIAVDAIDKELLGRMKAIEHAWKRLELFSPYDRLGSYIPANAIAEVERQCRAFAELAELPQVDESTGMPNRPPDKVRRLAQKLADTCSGAFSVLGDQRYYE